MHPRIPRLVMVAPMIAALAVTLAASGGASTARSDTPALKSITSRLDGAVSTVLIEASEPVAYLTSQPDPLTVLVDLRNVNADALGAPPMTPLAPVTGVAIERANAPDGSPVARVRVTLDRAAKHRVRSARNVILVEVERSNLTNPTDAPQLRNVLAAPKAPTFAKATADKPALAARTTARAPATELRSLKVGDVADGYAITLAGNGPLVASAVDEAKDLPPRILLDFRNVSTGKVPAVTNVNTADIQRVRVAYNSRDPLITRVVIDLARKIPYTVETVGEDLRVLFNKVVAATTAAVTPAPELRPAASAPVAPLEEPVAAPAPRVDQPMAATIAQPEPVQLTSAPAVVAAVAAPQTPAPPQPAQPVLMGTAGQTPQRLFTGDPVTLDFQGADLRAVLRTFAEISNGLNIVIDPSINGTVDISLRDVPWDQALDIILRANKLGYIVEGNIVRIVPLTVLAQEREEQRKLADATALAGDLRVLTRSLSYAKAADLVPIITRSALSSRGDVQIDARTNTLIIRDLADRLTNAAELITALDRPQPQVEIEARIVQVDRNASKDLGILWGLNGRVDPSIGTATGLTFPSSINAGGSAGGVSAAAPNAIQLALGSVTGALNIDVALRALESQGKSRILSTPRVVTQNNVEAEITQGSQIPIQTVSNNTVTVTFKDAALTLKVTPQITASNTVIMRIFVEKAAPNYSQTTPAAPTPSIDTQRAVTSVLVADGDTTVIGGIFTETESTVNQRTPGLHRIPFLGWLFKTDSDRLLNGELLIFITPRIAK
jgi:type IV pilus assembly protein PilQ